MLNGARLGIAMWISGLITGSFLMVGDELINFAQCCKDQLYPFPLVGSYTVWTSWEIVFGVLALNMGLTILLLTVKGGKEECQPL